MLYRHHEVFEDSGYTVLARILDHDGDAIKQADVTSIAWTVADRTIPGTVVASGTHTVASVVFDTLQTADSRWTQDTTGFNFAAAMAATTIPTGGKIYQLRYTFTPASGEVYQFPVELHTRGLLGV